MTDVTTPATTPTAAAASARARNGIGVVLVWELEKLTAQLRTRLALLACLLGPFAFVLAVQVSGNVPADTLFGRWVRDSGYATPLVVLGFAAAWGVPLLTCLVAGDIFAAEDHYGTWSSLLTRSRGRGVFFVGKLLAVACYVVAALAVLTATSLAAGLLVIGHQPLIGLSGNTVTGGTAVRLILLAWASVLPPALAYAALGVLASIMSRRPAVGVLAPVVVGLLMQFATMIDGIDPIRRVLLSTQLIAWHGLFAAPSFTGPLAAGVIVSAVYLVALLGGAWWLFRRRDFAGG